MKEIRDLGVFGSMQEVWAEYPTGGQNGDYIKIGNDTYLWNGTLYTWVNKELMPDMSGDSVQAFDKEIHAEKGMKVADEIEAAGLHSRGNGKIDGNFEVLGTLRARHIIQPNKGLYSTEEKLKATWPKPEVGDWATVGSSVPGRIWVCKVAGKWEDGGAEGGTSPIPLESYVSKDSLHDSRGTDPETPMSQKGVTDELLKHDTKLSGIEEQLDGLIARDASLGISVTPSSFFEGESKNVTVTANLTGPSTTIVIKKGGTVLKHQENSTSAVASDTITTSATYTAEATVKGRLLTASAKASAYYPIYVGAGTTYTEVAVAKNKQTVRSSPAGTYMVNVTTSGHTVMFIVPNTMNIKEATMNKYGFYLAVTSTPSLNGTTYKVYESNPMQAGSYTIVVS